MKLTNPFARKSTGTEQSPAKFPESRVGYAVGDIHGRADLLHRLLVTLEARANDERREGGPPIVIFLGDYVDRGPASADVIETLLNARPNGYERRFLKGNHEQAMLAFMNDPMNRREWIAHGGLETLVSYGVKPVPFFGAPDDVWVAAAQSLKEKLPHAHLEFLERLERYVLLGDYAFVHAGIAPGKPLEEQRDQDLLWIRDKFLNDRTPFPHRIVHGHTPTARPHMDHRRIGIDTGAYASGRLTAARFEGEEVTFVETSV
jgi:serine/threonine protein phosphatase 1